MNMRVFLPLENHRKLMFSGFRNFASLYVNSWSSWNTHLNAQHMFFPLLLLPLSPCHSPIRTSLSFWSVLLNGVVNSAIPVHSTARQDAADPWHTAHAHYCWRDFPQPTGTTIYSLPLGHAQYFILCDPLCSHPTNTFVVYGAEL